MTLKGIIIQDDDMSPFGDFFLNLEFWSIFFFPRSATVQVKVHSEKQHVE